MVELLSFLDYHGIEYKVINGNVYSEIVDLTEKGIESLPDDIGLLRCNLLLLGLNSITRLPESIGNIVCEDFNLSYNKICEVPDSFSSLKCKTAYLFGNEYDLAPRVSSFTDTEISSDYIYCDGILTWYDKVKTVGEYKVYIGIFGKFVATKDDVTFAHGETLRNAIRDLIFKLSDRDKEIYRGFDTTKQMSLDDAVQMYRIITGACSAGVDMFMERKHIMDTISVDDIIGMLDINDYGSGDFIRFFR